MLGRRLGVSQDLTLDFGDSRDGVGRRVPQDVEAGVGHDLM